VLEALGLGLEPVHEVEGAIDRRELGKCLGEKKIAFEEFDPVWEGLCAALVPHQGEDAMTLAQESGNEGAAHEAVGPGNENIHAEVLL
jgi:hypothetical protein